MDLKEQYCWKEQALLCSVEGRKDDVLHCLKENYYADNSLIPTTSAAITVLTALSSSIHILNLSLKENPVQVVLCFLSFFPVLFSSLDLKNKQKKKQNKAERD